MGPCMLKKYEHMSYPLISMVNYSDTMKTFLFSIDQAVNKVSAILGCCLLNSNSLDHNHLNTEYSMFNGDGELRRIGAKLVAKFCSRFKGAGSRVKTLKKKIADLTTQINERSVVREVKGIRKRVHLSFPEVERLRDKRNILNEELVQAQQEYKDYRGDYLEAVQNNKKVSRAKLSSSRKAVSQKDQNNVLNKFKKLLTDAASNGGKATVISLQEVALSEISEKEFKKFVKEQTGVYIPKYADLSKVRDLMASWKDIPADKVSE